MDTASSRPLSPEAGQTLDALNRAVEEAMVRKRKLGQYWVEWDGERPVKVYPENPIDTAAE